MKQCDWCNNYFTPSVSYQIYCSLSCREEATKEKIAERHKILKKQKRKSKVRYCAGKCGQKLSVYNDHDYCAVCVISPKELNKKIKEVRMFMHEYENDTDS